MPASMEINTKHRDLARRHIENCALPGHEVNMPTLKRGRKRRCCDRCSRRKVSCDTKMPCARCRASSATCTYAESGNTPSSATAATDHSQTSSAGPSTSEQRGGISVDFLLNFTDPSGFRPSAAIVAEAPELNGKDGEASTLQPRVHVNDHHINEQSFSELLDDSSVFFGFPFLMSEMEDEYAAPIIGSALMPELDETYALKVRVKELVHHLSAQHNSMLGLNNGYHGAFDMQLAETIFTVANVRHFVSSFFQYFHYSFPVLHKPTFDIQTVSIALLLLVMFFGSLSARSSDISIAMSHFYRVVEAYIFDHVVALQIRHPQTPAICVDNEELEVLQAGLLALVLMNNSNDLPTRRRLRLQRIPSLVTAVRAAGLFAYRRQYFKPGLERRDWQGFIYDEMRLR